MGGINYLLLLGRGSDLDDDCLCMPKKSMHSFCLLADHILPLQAFHSAQEVMASDHVEIHLQPAASIVSKCKIHTLEQYMVSFKAFHIMTCHVQHT